PGTVRIVAEKSATWKYHSSLSRSKEASRLGCGLPYWSAPGIRPNIHLRRPYTQGRKAGRSADPTADKVRVGDKSQHRERTWARNSADAARPRRRGNRMSCHGR